MFCRFKTKYQYIMYRLQATVYSETNSSKIVTADYLNEGLPIEWKRVCIFILYIWSNIFTTKYLNKTTIKYYI